jgi:hypothetical protein
LFFLDHEPRDEAAQKIIWQQTSNHDRHILLTMMTTPPAKHPVEASDSFANYVERNELEISQSKTEEAPQRRSLKQRQTNDVDMELVAEQLKQQLYDEEEQKRQTSLLVSKRKHAKKEAQLLEDSGIRESTKHGMMIDAGSGGSRMHVFEWNPRVLSTPHEVTECVAGKKLTYPLGDSRWTDRLSPGLSSFASKSDSQLLDVSTFLFHFLSNERLRYSFLVSLILVANIILSENRLLLSTCNL